MKTENEINEMATIIINKFSPLKFNMLYDALQTMFEVWNMKASDFDDPDYEKIQLARTAYVLSFIAENFSKDLVKITKKAPDFWEECEKRVAAMEAKKKEHRNNFTS